MVSAKRKLKAESRACCYMSDVDVYYKTVVPKDINLYQKNGKLPAIFRSYQSPPNIFALSVPTALLLTPDNSSHLTAYT
jgi:hypothetical protein